MQVRIPRKNLSEALNHLERLIPARSSNTVLTNLKIETKERGLALSGTNLEIDLELVVPAEVQGTETLTTQAQLFSQVVRSLPGEMVELDLEGQELIVTSGGATFKLQTGGTESYPNFSFSDNHDLSLDAKEFMQSISAVRYAAATEEFRAVFRGVQVELNGKHSRVVATDGFRLAYHDFGSLNTEARKLVIPARNADELIKVFRDGEVKLAFLPGILSVASNQARMNIKLMEGELPDYERVIPKNSNVNMEINADELRQAVSRVAVVADKHASNKVELIVAGGKLQLVAESESGRAQDSLDIKQSGSEPAITVGFRAKQLLEALAPIDGVANIGLGQNTPAVFRSEKDSGYLAIVNPLRV